MTQALNFVQNLLELFCTLYSPPHPSPRNGFEEKLPCSAAYILPLSHLHCPPKSRCIGPTHISGCTTFKAQCDTHLVKRYFQIARDARAVFTFAGLCSREHIKSQQGLRLWLAGLSRYPPTLKRSKDETVAQSEPPPSLHIVMPSFRLAVADFKKGRIRAGSWFEGFIGVGLILKGLSTGSSTVGSQKPSLCREGMMTGGVSGG